jgi:hypothetical protein
MMTKLWLYAYAVGTRSCRKLAKLATRDVGCMMLAAGNRPDFRTLNSFRLRHLAALGGLFQQVLLLCREEGLVKRDHVTVDGTKLKANASKHAAMSYDRMQPEVDRITAELDTWFRECDQTDAEEDAKYGADNDGDELPENLRTAGEAARGDPQGDQGPERAGPGRGEDGAGCQGAAELHRPGVADHEGRRWCLHPGLQRAGGGGCLVASDRGGKVDQRRH